MLSTTTTSETFRKYAEQLFASIGVSRIIVVDDQYSPFDVDDLLGICAAIGPKRAVELPQLDTIDFEAPDAIWTNSVRKKWKMLDAKLRQYLVARARLANSEESPPPTTDDTAEEIDDATAASSLEVLLSQLEACSYITLSLGEWTQRSEELLADAKASTTILLFDRDFSGEEAGTRNTGLELIRDVQASGTGYFGLISHTIPLESEYDAWLKFADKHRLDRDRLVVISKLRLTGDPEDYAGFLGMLRLVALSGRFANVKSIAWSIFQDSVTKAEKEIERLSVLDFERIVFESSRREGVWEPDTLFRVFGILMRRNAQPRLHETEISSAIAEARRVSQMPQEVARAVRQESASQEALHIQRFEIYESGDELNNIHAPIELGDIFERDSNGKRYILLEQPCDLMVRSDGKRSYDKKLGRTGTLVELAYKQVAEKGSWGELPFYDEGTGNSAYANFGRAHQVRLAVLDLCAICTDGSATIQVEATSPELLIVPWKARHTQLKRVFKAALGQWKQLNAKQLKNELKSLALPRFSTTLRVAPVLLGENVQYGVKRVMRLRQPWSGALLTSFTQYQARAAFEHALHAREDLEGGQ